MLTIDAIYKTNGFRMALVNIIEMISMNRNFYTTSVFLTGEKKEDYDIIFSDFKMLYDFWKLSYPVIFITDSYETEIKTLKKIFPEINHILCIFYINNNILVKLKSKIKTEYNRENGLINDNNNDEEEFT